MEEISEFEKMTSGGLYHAMVPELISRRARAKLLSREYNTTIGYDIDMNKRQRHLEEIFGKVGSNCTIEPPLRVDYGKNISIGENVYFNFDVVILDWYVWDFGFFIS